ncbi:hypothetical protein ELUMI_v1c04870 [Williamsoniiplasma luminosum]|uniref:Uncharacterized protein n=2 Tax=Williamsoniiplasma luminosum TaxID=214888 RepID=A0A2K8NWU4_9MOLU|nr:hypothetical protein ELUMI_v1c04870 [Williamsoniiplasma luminosum]
MCDNGIENNPYYENCENDPNFEDCYSCSFNKRNNLRMNMCLVKTTKNKIGRYFIESDNNGDIYIKFCVDCMLQGFASGKEATIKGTKLTKRYDYSDYWKIFEKT